eukprot:TRINITY_DN2444_c0_g4_i7.p1 TRINITY_DN2444_c0_g4~~TRINITY_DN2444_c0_g4_i7.p1  ORF type:complete len:139 (+),score=35.61 TRINITY_DN2444_c0_g4_i7:302-718(+)
MTRRLPPLLIDPSIAYVIILGGTNDLGQRNSSQIIKNLDRLYKHVKATQAFLVALTIPSSAFTFPWYLNVRGEVNSWIRNNKEVDVLVDLEESVPFSFSSGLWDDSLHFSPEGYDLVGLHIFEACREHFTNFASNSFF